MTADSIHRINGKLETPAIPLSRRPATRIAFGFLVAIAYASVLAGAGFFISGAVNSLSQNPVAAHATIEAMPVAAETAADPPSPPQAAALVAPADAAPAAAAPPESPPASPSVAAAPDAAPVSLPAAPPAAATPAAPPVEVKAAAVESPPAAVATPPQPSAASRDFEARGDERLAQGDIASARLFYERAADDGDARAARRLGNSFDPAFLARWGARLMRADPDAAARWYRRAGTLGDAEAAQDLAALQKQ